VTTLVIHSFGTALVFTWDTLVAMTDCESESMMHRRFGKGSELRVRSPIVKQGSQSRKSGYIIQAFHCSAMLVSLTMSLTCGYDTCHRARVARQPLTVDAVAYTT
jgi:hypothetical protein